MDTEITDTVLLLGGAQEQQTFFPFLQKQKFDSIVGAYAKLFLSTSREELSTTYAQFDELL